MNIDLCWIYVYGWLVMGGALVAKFSLRDIAASYTAALAWPILLPSQLLRKILK